MKHFEDLSGIAFQQKMRETNGAVVLDVRTEEEFDGGHIPGSINLDILDGTFQDNLPTLDKSKTYFVYCRSGGRSAQACSVLNSMGYTAVNLAGGLMRWTGELE